MCRVERFGRTSHEIITGKAKVEEISKEAPGRYIDWGRACGEKKYDSVCSSKLTAVQDE